MESPGEYLKREREHRGVTLSAVHEATRISMKYLRALEDDDLDAQPHATFTKGFIKSYCKHLGLDETDAVLRYEMFIREKAERVDNFRAEDYKGGKKRQAPYDIRYLYAAAATVVIIAVFYLAFMRKGPKTAPQTASVAAQAKDTAVQPQMQHQTQAQPQPQAKATAGPGEQAKAAPPMQAAAVKVEKPQEKPPVKDAAKAADKAESKEKKHLISISASELVWLKMGIDDHPAFNVILKGGESASWRAEKGFRLVVGNAGGVSITFDGKKLEPLGPSGKVVNINLPQGFVDAKPAAPPEP
ncbi:MAG: DUF4115 domain-containing protein [Deltaproteobacteria bacterium]|nr:DUF4115 domain-containing protein [Deltaproteobacteria bacterium]